jgi:hypothetical protein
MCYDISRWVEHGQAEPARTTRRRSEKNDKKEERVCGSDIGGHITIAISGAITTIGSAPGSEVRRGRADGVRSAEMYEPRC